MDKTEELIIKISDIFKGFVQYGDNFYSKMLKLFPNMEPIDATEASVFSVIAINYAFLDGLHRYKVPDEKVKEISGVICYMLTHIEPRLVEMLRECEKYVFNLKEVLINKNESKCNPEFLAIFPYGCWIFEKLYARPPVMESQGEMKQVKEFGADIFTMALLTAFDMKKSLLPFSKD